VKQKSKAGVAFKIIFGAVYTVIVHRSYSEESSLHHISSALMACLIPILCFLLDSRASQNAENNWLASILILQSNRDRATAYIS